MSFSNNSTVPIHMLPGIGSRTAKVLQSLEISTVGQFKQLPESVLIELFGPSIRSVHKHVNGKKNTTRTKKKMIKRVRSRKKLSVGKKFQVVAQFVSML